MRPLYLLIIFLLTGYPVISQTLVRKAIIGISGKAVLGGIRIDSVLPHSTAAAIKLRKNDIIVSFNNSQLTTMEAYSNLASQVRTGDDVTINYLRNNKAGMAKGKAVMRPLETSDIADISYDWIKFRNGYLRTITRKPKGKQIVPCILLIPGYGCGSIENFSSGYNGKLINEWIKNGYAAVTVEKSGMGDSFGCTPCTDADLVTDIESFDAGYRYMQSLPFADTTKLFIWGHSMGGIIAPEIAKLHHAKGVMVFGTVFRPWSEFLLEMHRVQKPLLEGLTYDQTETFVRLIQKVYYEFFVLKKTREQLFNNPEYAAIVVSELEHKPGSNNMWGRHWRFWQQLDSLNMADSWKRTNCAVLVLNGGTDYEQCAPIEPVLIEQTVNSVRPGSATRIQIDDLDHFMMTSKSYVEAVANFKSQAYTKGNFNYKLTDEVIGWLNKQTGKS